MREANFGPNIRYLAVLLIETSPEIEKARFFAFFPQVNAHCGHLACGFGSVSLVVFCTILCQNESVSQVETLTSLAVGAV